MRDCDQKSHWFPCSTLHIIAHSSFCANSHCMHIIIIHIAFTLHAHSHCIAYQYQYSIFTFQSCACAYIPVTSISISNFWAPDYQQLTSTSHFVASRADSWLRPDVAHIHIIQKYAWFPGLGGWCACAHLKCTAGQRPAKSLVPVGARKPRRCRSSCAQEEMQAPRRVGASVRFFCSSPRQPHPQLCEPHLHILCAYAFLRPASAWA